MDSTVQKVEAFGLENFINANRSTLCKRTVSPAQVAAALKFTSDEISKINHPPDNFSRCEKLYELIQKKSKVRDFIEALEETGNDHIIEFIESVDLLACGQSSSASANLTTDLWFNIPEPIDSFYGREDFLTQLHDKLKPGDDSETEVTVLSQVKIVSGLGGIGKTETARKYMMKYRKFYNNFIWISAESENLLTNSFLKLADELQIPVKNPQGKPREIDDIVKEIYSKITEGGKSNLIIFDNAEDYQSCKKFFPLGLHPDLKRPVILATSRNQEWISHTGKKIQFLPLDVLTDDESLEFILKELEIPGSDIPEFKEESKEFIELLGGLPLALQQAVAYIRQEKELRELGGSSYKISDYVQEFKLSMERFLKFSPVPPPDSSPTVYITWNVTLLKLFDLAHGEEAIKILTHLSFLYADKVPFSFLHSLLPEIEERTISFALKLIEKYSLIKINKTQLCLSIHRQLQCVILQYLQESRDISKVVPNLVNKCVEMLKDPRMKLSESGDAFLNFHQIASNPFNLSSMGRQFVQFLYEFATVLWTASRFSESLLLFQKVYCKQRQSLGADHSNTLTIQHQIAVQLYQLGRLEEAIALFREILKKIEIRPSVIFNHSFILTIKYNIAAALLEQEKYKEALELSDQVLAHQTTTFGENHLVTLLTRNLIAVLHIKLTNYPAALALFQDLEERQLKVLNEPNHRDVLRTMTNRASVLYEMGKCQEASTVFTAVYERKKEILGENHLDTINTLHWIAKTLQDEEKWTGAFDLFQKVYECRRSELGEDHPQTIVTRYNIAHVLGGQKKYQESLNLFLQVLDQHVKVLGAHHRETLKTHMQIAVVHSNLGQFSQAVSSYEELEKKQMEMEALQPKTQVIPLLTTRHKRADALYDMGKKEEACTLFQENYERQKELLGEHHPDTSKTLSWINRILQELGQSTEALDMHKMTI